LTIKDERIARSRCWGYFINFEDAEKCIKENWGDIYEYGYYNHAVIESVPEGICPKATEKWYSAKFNKNWYQPNYEKDFYEIEEIDKPHFLKQIIGFSIG